MLKKPRPRFLMMSFSLVAMLLLILSACGRRFHPRRHRQALRPVHRSKGVPGPMTYLKSRILLIPNASSETFSNLVDTTIYAPLFLGNAEGPDHAGHSHRTAYDANGGISADLKTWTFHLKIRPEVVRWPAT